MKIQYRYFLTLLAVLLNAVLHAQICKNPADTIYGLNSITGSGSGQIIGINVNDAGTTLIGSPAATSANANGLGFSQVNGLYYFFNQIGAGTTEFVSFNPLTGTKIARAIPSGPALPTTSSGKIRSGAVNKAGTGYYTIFPAANTTMGYPSTNPAFYYYNIALDSWTLITQTFKDVSGNVVAPIKSLVSGDMAFDGNDNLWLLSSSSSFYALYRIRAPLPTTAVASVTVDTIIPQTATPGNVSFTGIAFNSAGKLYLSTGSYSSPPGVAGNNQLYELATATGTFTNKGTLPNGYGDDLTSCSFPVGVLAIGWQDFTATLSDNAVKLSWKAEEDNDVTGYNVEYSANGSTWQTIGYVTRQGSSDLQTYDYLHTGFNKSGSNYYRVAQVSANDRKIYSSIRFISGRKDTRFYLGPNPVNDVIHLYNNDITSKQLAQIFDKSGRLVYSAAIDPATQSINVSQLAKGVYIIKLLSADGDKSANGYQFIKW